MRQRFRENLCPQNFVPQAITHVIDQNVKLCIFVCKFKDDYLKKKLGKFKYVSICGF